MCMTEAKYKKVIMKLGWKKEPKKYARQSYAEVLPVVRMMSKAVPRRTQKTDIDSLSLRLTDRISPL